MAIVLAVVFLSPLIASSFVTVEEPSAYAQYSYGGSANSNPSSNQGSGNNSATSSGNSFNTPAANTNNDSANAVMPPLLSGQVSNVQLGGGQPAWIESGWWVLRFHPNQQNENQSTAWFTAKVTMIKPDGTAPHMHWIYNFTLSNFSNEGNSTIVFNGNANVVMPSGPVSGVPVTIKILNMNVFAIWIGPDKVNGHFGGAPIYGTVFHSSEGRPFVSGQAMMGKSMTMNLTKINVPIVIPLEKGLYDKKDVFFITPEISDQPMAALLTNLTKFPVTYAPALANTPHNQALGNIYIFKNGLKGVGALGFQADVFDSIPGDTGYTPLWRVNYVEWKTGAINASTPALLGSDDAVLGAASNGQVTINQTGIVRNCPIIEWGGNKDNTISPGQMMVRSNNVLTDNTPFGGGQLLSIDTTGMQAAFVAHRAFGPDGSTIYHIALDASVNNTANGMGIIYTNNTEGVAQSNASSDTFQFANGLAASGPQGFQPDIGSANPGDTAYSPMERIQTVSWTDPSKAVLIQNTRDLRTYGDQLKISDAGMIIDSPAFNATTVMEHMNTTQSPTPNTSSSGSSNGPSNSTNKVSIQPNSPSLAGMAFSPNPLTIKAGTTVTWTNNDNTAHTVTSDSGLFDSGPIQPGQTFQHTFSTAGQFAYHCKIHPQMTGEVNVS